MPDSLQQIACALSRVVVRPSLGSGELVVTVLVACGFAFSAVHSAFARRHGHDGRWPEQRHS